MTRSPRAGRSSQRGSSSPSAVFDYNEALQEAFYHRGFDPTDPKTFRAIAREQNFAEHAFDDTWHSEEAATETRRDFELSRAMGVHGYPSTLVRDGDNITIVSRGWLPPKQFIGLLGPWLEDGTT